MVRKTTKRGVLVKHWLLVDRGTLDDGGSGTLDDGGVLSNRGNSERSVVDGLDDGCSGGRGRGTDGTALFGAVGVHPVRVLGAFTGLSPTSAFLGTFHGVGDSVLIGASFFDSRATGFVFFAHVAARLHAVGDHPGGVFSALRFSGGSPFVAVFVGVCGAEVVLFLGGAGFFFQSNGLGADRAARFLTEVKHPFRVFGAFTGLCPDGAVGISIVTFGIVCGTVFGVFLGHGIFFSSEGHSNKSSNNEEFVHS